MVARLVPAIWASRLGHINTAAGIPEFGYMRPGTLTLVK